ncbi:sodium-independent sulfate anion transporter-like [Prorops nasuta]|uniref:sodium-independent sulfate anion transporter-like n=1 Tax=Prorops nasuta TaxID=863751 RepID=UPI0034CFFD6D
MALERKTSINMKEEEEDEGDERVVTRSSKNFGEKIVKLVPIAGWLPKYTKFQAISDLIAGISLGLTMIPQSMAYAALSGLTPQYGLYSSFLGGFIYIFFGTIKEVSIGPTSLMALLTIEYTRDMPVEFVILLTFLAGCVELAMGIFNLGCLVEFISIPVTSGFTSATSIIVVIAQIQGLLGLKIKTKGVIDSIIKVCQNLTEIKMTDSLLGISSIIFLLSFRKLKDIQFGEDVENSRSRTGWRGKMKKICWFLSNARNAFAVFITSLISFHLTTRESSPFTLSGKVQPGLPNFTLPSFSSKVGNESYSFFEMCSQLGSGIFVVPVIAVLANVAIAKAFASGAAVNASQEMLTLGMCNIIGSFFSSMPTAGAFTRSAVSSASGVQTPGAGLYTGIMSLLALAFLTTYFYYIPRAVLSAILISAVIFMIDIETTILLWRGSKRDAFLTISTFLIGVLISVEVGLFLGVLLNLIFLLQSSSRPKITAITKKANSGVKYLLVQLDSGLSYAAMTKFSSTIMEIAKKSDGTSVPLVLDCERLRVLDYTAIKGIERLTQDLQKKGYKFFMKDLNQDIIECINIVGNLNNFNLILNDKQLDELINNALLTNNQDINEKPLENECLLRPLKKPELNDKKTDIETG